MLAYGFKMSLMQTLKKKGLEIIDSLANGRLRAIYDGNMAHATIFRSYKGAKHVGTDEHGNKYWFQPAASYQQTRWVIYADMRSKEISRCAASSVHVISSCMSPMLILMAPCSIPPEWSHWLNYMSDDIPAKGDMSGERPMYFVTREAFVTGERPYMLPKGSWLNPEKVI